MYDPDDGKNRVSDKVDFIDRQKQFCQRTQFYRNFLDFS